MDTPTTEDLCAPEGETTVQRRNWANLGDDKAGAILRREIIIILESVENFRRAPSDTNHKIFKPFNCLQMLDFMPHTSCSSLKRDASSGKWLMTKVSQSDE